MTDRPTGRIAESDEAATRARGAAVLRKAADDIEAGMIDAVELSTTGSNGDGGYMGLFPASLLQNAELARALLGIMEIRKARIVEAHTLMLVQYEQQGRPSIMTPNGVPPGIVKP